MSRNGPHGYAAARLSRTELASTMPKNKKQKLSASSRDVVKDSPIFKASSTHKKAQTRLLDSHPDLLADFLSPSLTNHEFLTRHFRQQAVYIPSAQGGARVEKVVKAMLDLNVKQLFENTASDNVFVWLQQKMAQENGKSSKQINSVEVSDPNMAYALYQAGHATYCRAPPEVENLLLRPLLENTGLGCGQYDPSGQSMTTLGRAEVETFISTSTGSVTGWHTDFQENFTFQLSGRKKWSLQRGSVQHVLRGVTPHYAVSAVEGQVKAGRLDDPNFSFGPPTLNQNAVGPIDEVILEPGDVLYFPAGMWHKIDVLEPGVSINCSLMATNYATLICQSLQHVLLQRPEWRASVCRPPDGSPITNNLEVLLQNLPQIIKDWTNQQGAAQGILPPVLHHGKLDTPNESDNDDSGNEVYEDEWSESENQRENLEGTTMNPDLSEREGEQEDVDDNSALVLLDEEPPTNETFDPSSVSLQARWKTHRLARNPLALLINERDIVKNYQKKSTAEEGYFYILNVNFAGNEAHESHLRVRLRSDKESLDKMSPDALAEKFLKMEPSIICWLLYLGYLVWTPRKA